MGSPLPPGLPVPVDDGTADRLRGAAMPPVGLEATDGDAVQLDALGPGRTILYFYPRTGAPGEPVPDGWDGIPGARGCTAEACDFRDHLAELAAAGAARVFGVSSQDSGYQREVVERLHLPFALLSDTSREVARRLHLPTFTFDGAELYRRLTLVVRDDAVEHAFHPVFPPDRHAAEVLAWLRLNP